MGPGHLGRTPPLRSGPLGSRSHTPWESAGFSNMKAAGGSRFSTPGHDSSSTIPSRSDEAQPEFGEGERQRKDCGGRSRESEATSDASRAPTCSRCSPQCSSVIVAPVHGPAGAGLWWRRIRRRHKETEVTSNRGQLPRAPRRGGWHVTFYKRGGGVGGWERAD